MSFINTRGSALNYVRWSSGSQVFCAELNSPGDASKSLESYVHEFSSANSLNDKLDVAKRWGSSRWTIHIPVLEAGGLQLNVGDIEGSCWTYTVQKGLLSGVKIAIHNAREGNSIPVTVRPVTDADELNVTHGAGLIIEI